MVLQEIDGSEKKLNIKMFKNHIYIYVYFFLILSIITIRFSIKKFKYIISQYSVFIYFLNDVEKKRKKVD